MTSTDMKYASEKQPRRRCRAAHAGTPATPPGTGALRRRTRPKPGRTGCGSFRPSCGGWWRPHLPAGLPSGLGEFPFAFPTPVDAPLNGGPASEAAEPVAGAQFLSRSFSNPAGTRPYKLFVPSGYTGQPVALVVMLHGCTQSPDDFAAGTGMNELAEAEGFLVVYPGQPQSAHPQKCWKWFSAADQQRGRGEPSLIAGITRQVMRDYAVDPRRVYVAGMSAGGAAAAIMAETYPELYAAAGVHSGLACGAARDLPSALAAMKGGAAAGHGAARYVPQGRTVPVVVFHGDRDTTVSPRNADAVAAQSAPQGNRIETRTGQTRGGHAFTCTVRRDAAGNVGSEQWTVHGAGHAWSGGRAAGSFTDPRGPDASREMLRFFREHPHPMPA